MNTIIERGRIISVFERQINKLERREISRLFGIQPENLEPWLAEFGVTEASLADAGGKSFIVLPSGLIQPSKQRNFWEQLCPNLNLSDTMIERVMPHLDDDLPTEAYVLKSVFFDLQSETAEKAVEDWPRLQKELMDVGRKCLTGQELITLVAYDSRRFDAMLALGSTREGVVPCFEPISDYWEFSLHCLGNMIDRETKRWVSPFGGAKRVVAPTAKRL